MPGQTIGVLGGGQLGRMMALAARRMGYRIVVLDPNPRCPTAQVSDGVVVGALDDREAAVLLAKQVDVITLDTEHVPAEILDELETHTLGAARAPRCSARSRIARSRSSSSIGSACRRPRGRR